MNIKGLDWSVNQRGTSWWARCNGLSFLCFRLLAAISAHQRFQLNASGLDFFARLRKLSIFALSPDSRGILEEINFSVAFISDHSCSSVVSPTADF
jgi:hypothetical protein